VATLSSLSFDDGRSGTGPASFTVQISQIANFTSGIYTSAQQTSHTSVLSGANSFPLALSNLTGTIYFRLYGYASTGSGGTWRIDNLKVQGSVTSGASTIGNGWYVDSVSIQDAFCCTNTTNPPVADFTGSPTTGTEPLAVTFNDNSTGTISNWFWDFGDSSTTNIATNSVVHTYAAGTYDVMLIATGPDGVSTNIKAGYITAWTPFQSWQIQYFGSTTNPAAAGNVDPDGDGQNNLAEFLAGSDPTNSASALRITSITTQGTDVLVSWTMGAGKTNALQVTSGDPGGGYATNGFADIFAVTNTVGTTTNYLDVGGAVSVPARYYRVRLVP
jgi:PKD repeat protein